MATTDQHTIQGSLTPNFHSVRFLGGATDCSVQVDAAAVAAKADSTGTITALVMIPSLATATGTILGFGDDNVVEFIQFSIEAGLLTLRSTDNTTAQFVTQADAVGFSAHKWHHVAAVQPADGAGPRLYIDGVRIAVTNDTATDVDSWGSELSGLDKGFIGAANKAGDSSETEELAGYLSQVRYYNTAKSTAEIKAIYEYDMFGLGSNDTTSLRNHWKFDEDLTDSGTGADNGTAVGGAILCNSANEFTSRLTFTSSPVVADKIHLAISDKTGFAHIIQAA